jgi:general stress protein YciG
MVTKVAPRKQGFAAMGPEKRKEVARRGGQTAHRLGKAHRFTPEEAREAGKKGGRSVSRDRAHMAEMGRKSRASERRRRAEAREHREQEP